MLGGRQGEAAPTGYVPGGVRTCEREGASAP